MTDILTVVPRPAVRSGGPSAVSQVGLEIRKSLSTRSGKSMAVASALAAPTAVLLLSYGGEPLDSVVGPIGAMGMITGLILLTVGVLSTATEWSHKTVETTFLLEPRRGRVMVAKAVAVAVMGAVLAAISIAASAAILSVAPVGTPSWDGAVMAMGVAVAAGAAFAVIGAGVGAAMANTPAALTTLYLTILGVMPGLRLFKPEIASKLDPADATLSLAVGHGGTTQVLILVGWVVVTTAAGVVLTRRRAVS
jgi:hypothetical protein